MACVRVCVIEEEEEEVRLANETNGAQDVNRQHCNTTSLGGILESPDTFTTFTLPLLLL